MEASRIRRQAKLVYEWGMGLGLWLLGGAPHTARRGTYVAEIATQGPIEDPRAGIPVRGVA